MRWTPSTSWSPVVATVIVCATSQFWGVNVNVWARVRSVKAALFNTSTNDSYHDRAIFLYPLALGCTWSVRSLVVKQLYKSTNRTAFPCRIGRFNKERRAELNSRICWGSSLDRQLGGRVPTSTAAFGNVFKIWLTNVAKRLGALARSKFRLISFVPASKRMTSGVSRTNWWRTESAILLIVRPR